MTHINIIRRGLALMSGMLLAGLACYGQNLDLNADANGQQAETETAPQSKQVQVGSQKKSVGKNVRNHIKEGNSLYNDKRYSEATVEYNKALELDPVNEVALFNLASSLLRSSGTSDPNDSNSPAAQAAGLFSNLIKSAENPEIVEKSFYNLGNMAYNKENYGESIEMYKNVLRRNPNNNAARENLRLAQLKQQQNQNQDQNQDQQQQNQDQQQQQQQEQQQQQNQDQNQQQQQQNQDRQQQQQQQQQQQMSDANAERILKAMENQESATRKKVEAQKAKEQQGSRRQPQKPW